MQLLKTIFTVYLLGLTSLSYSQTISFSAFDTLNGRHYSDISSGDINNDSVPDFLFTGTTNGANNYPVILKYTDTGFVVQTHFLGSFVENGQTDIRDMNNDNLVDAIYQGSGQKLRIQQQASSNSFTSQYVDYGTSPRGMDVGDYDNDGDLDVIVIGPHVSSQPLLHLYTNTGSGYVKTSPAVLTPRKEGDVAFGDFDGDYDLDLIISGMDSNNVDHSYIYQNINGVFSYIDSLPGVHYANIEIHDINGDGLEDIVLSGRFPGNYGRTRPYLNQGNFNFALPVGFNQSTLNSDYGFTVGDIDADGDLDLFTINQDGNFFYTNNGSGIFTKINTPFDSLSVGTSTLIDFEHDGDLDLVVSGYSHTTSSKEGYAYQNTGTSFNTLPTAPTSGNYFWSGNDIILTWNAGSDLETDSTGLTYNIFLVNSVTGQYIISPEGDTATGYRFRNARGNNGTTKGHLIKNLPSGSYTWGVQTVDNHFAGSTYFTQNISVCQSINSPTINIMGNDSICQGDSVLLNISPISGYSPVWYNNNGALSNSNTPHSIYVQPNTQVYAIFQDVNGCFVYSDTIQITGTVKPNPIILNNGINNGICENDSIRLKISGNYSSIQWLQNGLVTSIEDSLWLFNPDSIQLLVTDSTGTCTSDTAFSNIVRHSNPNIQFSPIQRICENSDSLSLNLATPIGGNYSGNGIQMNKFIASSVGAGNHHIYYSFTDTNGCMSTDTTQIIVDRSSSAGIISGDTSICMGDSASIMVNGSLGQNLQWQVFGSSWNSFSNSDTNQIFAPSNNAQYRTIITNLSCEADTSQIFFVQVDTLPIVQISSIADLCLNAVPYDILTQPIGGTFSGIGVSGTQFFTSISGAGTFDIFYEFTDSNQCSGTDTISVKVDSLSVAGNLISPDSLCLGQNTSLFLNGNTGSQISWTETTLGNSNTIATDTNWVFITPNQTSTYTIFVTNGVCPMDSITQTIRVDTITPVTLPNISTLCQNQSTFNATALPTGGNYFLNNVPSTQTISPTNLTMGVHEFKYVFTNTFGCISKDSMNFYVDSVSVAGTFANDTFQICEGNSQTLFPANQNGSILDWLVSNDSGQTWINLMDTNTFLTHTSAQTQNYRVITQNGVCAPDTSVTTTILVNPNPVVEFENDSLCFNESIADLQTLTNLTGGIFTGLFVNGNSFNPNTTGSFDLQYSVTDINGCLGTDSASILVHPNPIVQYDSVFQTCTTDTLVPLGDGYPLGGYFTGIGVNGTYWDANQSGVGNFEILYTYTDSNGCVGYDSSEIIVDPEIIVNIGDTLTLTDSIILDAGVFDNYLWNTGAVSQSIIVFNPGIYSVHVSQMNGCSGYDNVFIILSSLNETNPNLEVSVYPNPSSYRVTIEGRDVTQWDELILRNAYGKLVKRETVIFNRTSLDTSVLPSGSYWIEFLKNNQRILLRKIIVTH